MDTKLKYFIVNTLRKASYRWKPRTIARNAAKLGRNQYKCAKCGLIYGSKDIALDHINPVVPLTGWVDFDSYIERMFIGPEGFQVLCKAKCHKEKTEAERLIRQLNKKRK